MNIKLFAKLFSPEVQAFFRFSAIAGLLATTVLLINLNHKTFNRVLGERSKSLSWLFVLLSVVPLLLFLYIFSFLFGNTNLREQGELILKLFGRKL